MITIRLDFIFLTLCTHERQHFFGEIKNNKMELNESGRMIESVWAEIPDYYPKYSTGEFVVMPNHFHDIISILGAGPCAYQKFSGVINIMENKP